MGWRTAGAQRDQSLVADGGLERFSGHYPRIEGVGADAKITQLRGQHAGQPRHRCLASTVGITPAPLARRHRWVAFAGARGDIDHHSAAARDHVFGHRPGQQERGQDVALEHPLQGLRLQVHEPGIEVTALIDRVVDQHVDAPVLGQYRLAGVERRSAVEQVHRHHENAETEFAQRLGGAVEAAGQRRPVGIAQGVFMVFAFVEGTGADRQVETGTGERQCRLAANTPAGAGNECHFVHGYSF